VDLRDARQPQAAGGDCYLEIKVNGRSLQPICLDAAADIPGARVCAELDKLYQSRVVDTASSGVSGLSNIKSCLIWGSGLANGEPTSSIVGS
jgi:hypothetical protein